MIELFQGCHLLRVLWGGGGWWPPHWIAVWAIACGDLFSIHLYFLNFLKHICLIHRILNERKTSHLGQDCLYLYKNKEIYMYWVLLVVLLDLWQGLIVLKSSLFIIIWQFVGHGGKNFVWWVLLGWWHVYVCVCGGGGGDRTLWGCDPEWGGGVELATMLFILLQLIKVLTPGSNLNKF